MYEDSCIAFISSATPMGLSPDASAPPACTCSGASTTKELKPKSIVMPLSLDCGFLSKHAVLATVLRALAREVLPLSTCPSTPMLKFRVFPDITELLKN
ncbi:hypothetical protein E2C01_007002 [Portunus trituberculatus]|uniref:Uncharacterized protein n=1 Tax=Portunus trituberculatus TaxID=210409 RepID=A0A5B7D3C2_PORTR|nr:hypothetical protein [Portunus trituberculatus]